MMRSIAVAVDRAHSQINTGPLVRFRRHCATETSLTCSLVRSLTSFEETRMKRTLLLSGAVTAMLGAAPFAMADNAIVTDTDFVQIAQAAAGDIDAGKLVGQEVYDANGDKVGEIDSVMVDPKGKGSSVVIDVSGWLER